MVFVASFVIYLLTLCPTIYWEDSAAFCAVQSLLGIPHSPGFPVYVILGRLFTMLPIGDSALCSNFMSAFWGSAALAVLFFLILEIFKQARLSLRFSRLSAAVAVLLLGFSTSFWLQTVRAEVYTLNLFFTTTLIFLAVRWAKATDSSRRARILLLLAFILGLSLTNHPLLIITLGPVLVVYLLCSDFAHLCDPRRLVLPAILLTLGLSLYLYLPIRSTLLPDINWGKPDSWTNLLAYLFRTSQPTGSLAVPTAPYLNRFWFDLSFPVDQFGLPFFWPGAVGAISLYRYRRGILLLTSGVFFMNLLTATWATDFSLRNYDLLGYLLPSLCMFTVWFAVGLKEILGWLFKEIRQVNANAGSDIPTALGYTVGYLVLALVLLLPVFQMAGNLKQCDKHSQVWAQRYAGQILSSVSRDAVVLVGDDNTLTSLWHLNLACGMRPDVKVLSISGLTQKAYREQIARQYPDVRIPETREGDPGALAYQITRANADRFPVYCTFFSSQPLFVRRLRPAGYLYRLSSQEVNLTDKDIEQQKEFLERNLRQEGLDIVTREHFGNLVFNLGAFYDKTVGLTLSTEYFLWALDVDPSNSRIYFQLGRAFLRNGDKAKASEFFRAGLELEPYNLQARRLLEQT